MALSKEVIIANEKLKALSDDQIADLVALSLADENTVIGKKTGEIHGGYEKDILEVSGLPKNAGEKAFDYNKRVIKFYKDKAESVSTIQKDLDELKATKEDLERQIREGKGSEAVAKKLKDTEELLNQTKSLYDKESGEWKKQKEEYETKLSTTEINNAIEKSVAKLVFKKEIPQSLVNIALDEAKRKLLAENKADFIDDGKGGKTMVFRDDKGEIRRNPANKLEPFTASELLLPYLKDVVDGEAGGGAGSGGEGKPKVTISSLGAAKTQQEALKIIEDHLLAQGVKRLTSEFETQKAKFWSENKIASLPER